MAKKEKVGQMFDDIAPRYDLLNHLLSFQIDRRWRKKAIQSLCPQDKEHILDVACGTADFSIAAARAGARKVTGTDISEEMMKIGRIKVSQAGLQDRISLEAASCENLPYSDGSFSAATVAFGVRNFEDRMAGIRQIYRVLRPGGKIVVLEFSMPAVPVFRSLYLFYFQRLLPAIAGWVSGNRAAYTYLPESVRGFPPPEVFRAELEEAGFRQCRIRRFTGGIVALYVAVK